MAAAGLVSAMCVECGRNSNSHHTHQLLAGQKETEAEIARNGIVCSMWGPPRWFSLHMATFGFPAQPTATQRRHWATLVRHWEYELPCCCCRTNYRGHLQKLFTPGVLRSRAAFTKFGFDLHNEVNRKLGKKVLSPTDLAKARRFYESGRAGRDHKYGHALVVVEEQDKVRKGTHTIKMNPACVMK